MVSETFGLKPDGIRRGLGLKGCISGFVVSVCTYSSRIADDRWISRPPRRYRFSFLSYGLGRLSTFPCPAYGIRPESLEELTWEFPKIRGTLFGVLVRRILLFRVVY